MGRKAKIEEGLNKYGDIVIGYNGIADLLLIVEALTRMEHDIIEFGANEPALFEDSKQLRQALEGHMLRAHPERLIQKRKEDINRIAAGRGFTFRFEVEED